MADGLQWGKQICYKRRQGRFLSRIFYYNITVLEKNWRFIFRGLWNGWYLTQCSCPLSARECKMFFGSFCLRRVKRSKKILEAGGKKWEDTFFHYCGGRTKIFISQKYKLVKLITVNIKKNQIKISVKIILMKSGMKWNGNWNEIKRICIYITFYFSVYSFL